MAKKHSKHQPETLYSTINNNPGKKPSFFARILGWNRSDVTRTLPELESRGLLISEDEKGGLWIFRKK